MSIKWQAENLETVIRYFIDSYKPKHGEKIVNAEWFIDTAKGKVVFRLYVDEPPDNRPG